MDKQLIIITGLPGGGKSTISKQLSTKYGYEIITVDKFRYVSNTWIKLPYKNFRENVLTAITNCISQTVIIDSSYNDATDPENARVKLINELLKKAIELWIIEPEELEKQISLIIDRSINRYIGIDNTSTSPETSSSRAKLVIKNIQYYDDNVKFLDTLKTFYSFVNENNIIIKNDTFDNLVKLL